MKRFLSLCHIHYSICVRVYMASCKTESETALIVEAFMLFLFFRCKISDAIFSIKLSDAQFIYFFP